MIRLYSNSLVKTLMPNRVKMSPHQYLPNRWKHLPESLRSRQKICRWLQILRHSEDRESSNVLKFYCVLKSTRDNDALSKFNNTGKFIKNTSRYLPIVEVFCYFQNFIGCLNLEKLSLRLLIIPSCNQSTCLVTGIPNKNCNQLAKQGYLKE